MWPFYKKVYGKYNVKGLHLQLVDSQFLTELFLKYQEMKIVYIIFHSNPLLITTLSLRECVPKAQDVASLLLRE